MTPDMTGAFAVGASSAAGPEQARIMDGVDVDGAQRAVIGSAVQELLDSLHRFEHLPELRQLWADERDLAVAVEPGLARIYDSLQALALRIGAETS